MEDRGEFRGRIRKLVLLAGVAALSATWGWGSYTASAADGDSGATNMTAGGGHVRISRAGSWRDLSLPIATAEDVDVSASFSADKTPTGRGHSVVVIARRASGQGEYRVRARILSGLRVELSIVRVVGGDRQLLARSAPLSGLLGNATDKLS